MNRRWTREHLLLALNLYHQTPFGQQHKSHPPIIALAERLGRTPSSVAMKLSNFTSLDPVEQARGIKGLSGASQADRAIWDEFQSRLDALAEASEGLLETSDDTASEHALPSGPSEVETVVKARRHQSFFRKAVLGSYEQRCCISGLPVPEVLRASHIVPWSVDTGSRVDPRNGLCLAATYDAAFDRGLISVSESFQILVGERLKSRATDNAVQSAFLKLEGVTIRLPAKNLPGQDYLDWHRSERFVG